MRLVAGDVRRSRSVYDLPWYNILSEFLRGQLSEFWRIFYKIKAVPAGAVRNALFLDGDYIHRQQELVLGHETNSR